MWHKDGKHSCFLCLCSHFEEKSLFCTGYTQWSLLDRSGYVVSFLHWVPLITSSVITIRFICFKIIDSDVEKFIMKVMKKFNKVRKEKPPTTSSSLCIFLLVLNEVPRILYPWCPVLVHWRASQAPQFIVYSSTVLFTPRSQNTTKYRIGCCLRSVWTTLQIERFALKLRFAQTEIAAN